MFNALVIWFHELSSRLQFMLIILILPFYLVAALKMLCINIACRKYLIEDYLLTSKSDELSYHANCS